jgi:hypothetical protein
MWTVSRAAADWSLPQLKALKGLEQSRDILDFSKITFIFKNLM